METPVSLIDDGYAPGAGTPGEASPADVAGAAMQDFVTVEGVPIATVGSIVTQPGAGALEAFAAAKAAMEQGEEASFPILPPEVGPSAGDAAVPEGGVGTVPPLTAPDGTPLGPDAPPEVVAEAAMAATVAAASGPVDVVVEGSPLVTIEGRPIARIGDSTARGGALVEGVPWITSE